MTRTLIALATSASFLFPLAALAAPCSADKQAAKSSNVDPSPKADSQGARPASPGTVGAMNSAAGGSSFTAEKSDMHAQTGDGC